MRKLVARGSYRYLLEWIKEKGNDSEEYEVEYHDFTGSKPTGKLYVAKKNDKSAKRTFVKEWLFQNMKNINCITPTRLIYEESMALSKKELVKRAESVGLGKKDIAGCTKARLIFKTHDMSMRRSEENGNK